MFLKSLYYNREKEMKSEIRERVGCSRKLHIEVERERFDEEIKIALKNIRKDVQLPGFRKGKTPEDMLLRRFGDAIREEALKGMIPKVLQEAFEAEGINAVGEPALSDLQVEDNAPISFDVTVEELPQVDIEGFNGLEVTRKVFEITDEDIDASLDRLRTRYAEQEEVDREVRDGDIIVANLQKLDESGVPIIGEKLESRVLHLDGISTPSPDFDRQVVGMKKDDRRKVQFTYDETAENPDLAGTTDGYEVEVLRVFENRKPELTDEFAQSLGDYTDLADLREKTRVGMVRYHDNASERMLRSALIEEFVRQNPFEVPNSMVERVIQGEVRSIKAQYPGQDVDEDALRSKMRPDAVRAVQTYILLDTVKEKQEIEVNREEVDAYIEKDASERGVNARELRRFYIKEGRLDDLKNEIAQEKAYDWIKSVASIKDETVTREAPQSRIIAP